MISPWIEIDPQRIRHNVQAVKASFTPPRTTICVLKTNGYGHGIVDVARALSGVADGFAVVEARSAIRLREAGITEPLLLLSPFCGETLQAAAKYQFALSVNDDTFPDKIAHLDPPEQTVTLHVQLNTGMNRHGIAPENLPGLVRSIRSRPGFRLGGIYSNPSGVATALEEFQVFQLAVQACGPLPDDVVRHFSNSSVLLSHPETQLDGLRFGILTYGIFPRDDVPTTLDIRPALAWKARVNLVRDLPSGSVVGYGGTQRTTRPLRLAVISCGYGHGYSRRLGTAGGTVLIQGQRCPIIAPPNMNDMMVDVTGIDCRIGDEVVLIGRQGEDEIPIGELADRLETIDAEILCLLDRTPHRHIL